MRKRVDIEKVLKQYELDASLETERDYRDTEDLFDEIGMLLDEAAALFHDQGGDDESPIVGSFAFSNEDGMFEELDTMNGADLKVGGHFLLSISRMDLFDSWVVFNVWRWNRSFSS